MTGPSDLRGQLAAVLLAATTDYGTGKASPEVDLFDFYADALLPVVEKYARAHAADQLDAAIHDACVHGWDEAHPILSDRAAALRISIRDEITALREHP